MKTTSMIPFLVLALPPAEVLGLKEKVSYLDISDTKQHLRSQTSLSDKFRDFDTLTSSRVLAMDIEPTRLDIGYVNEDAYTIRLAAIHLLAHRDGESKIMLGLNALIKLNRFMKWDDIKELKAILSVKSGLSTGLTFDGLKFEISPRLTDPEREAVLKGLIFALDNLELVWPRDTAEQRNTL
ncbi:unnamed protein product [Albugo candida]|uniref:Uncharacterized protein n=2 Tax=Albugo candida TaxID=65357 RepID=A0A024GQD5_9STRA|nr:unnamed protein product [Albugo candida]|eukprot:CCI48578.1 unnamed protein product [Albugo candida]